jgi:HD-GYP domain-containing protein (c-di-GMP phosphodiesterase class II)
VAAADAFSAMCESRVYRPARSLDDAAQELERTSWTQFDGLCVRALVDSLN